jgi:hypothetical protein
MSLYGDTGNSFKNNPIADFFAGLGQFGKKFGEVSQQTQRAQVNPYGSTSYKAPTPTPKVTPRQLPGTADAMARRAGEVMPGAVTTPGGGGGGGYGAPAGDPTAAIFDPLFALIEKQREAANSRYAANKGEIENIFGQLTTARRGDVASTTAAYNALSSAAATRSTAVNAGIDASEAARLSGNEAVLQSMGLGDVSSARLGDVASEQAASAKNVEGINSANWQGLLSAMGANAQDIIGQDVQSYGYQQGRDTQALQRDLQGYQQGLDAQEFQTRAKAAEAKFQYGEAQKAAAASAAAAAARAAASATNAADKFAAEQAQDLIKNSDPLTRAILTGVNAGYPNFNPTKIQQAYNSWMVNRGTTPTAAGLTQWNKLSATADATKYIGNQLSQTEQGALLQAIGNSF